MTTFITVKAIQSTKFADSVKSSASFLEQALVSLTYHVVQSGTVTLGEKFALFDTVPGWKVSAAKAASFVQFKAGQTSPTDQQKEKFARLRADWGTRDESAVYALILEQVKPAAKVAAKAEKPEADKLAAYLGKADRVSLNDSQRHALDALLLALKGEQTPAERMHSELAAARAASAKLQRELADLKAKLTPMSTPVDAAPVKSAPKKAAPKKGGKPTTDDLFLQAVSEMVQQAA